MLELPAHIKLAQTTAVMAILNMLPSSKGKFQEKTDPFYSKRKTWKTRVGTASPPSWELYKAHSYQNRNQNTSKHRFLIHHELFC